MTQINKPTDAVEEKLNKKYQRNALMSREELFKQLETSEKGLSYEERSRRLSQNGYNAVSQQKNKTWIHFLIKSILDPFIIVLIILAIATYLISTNNADYVGSIIICFIAFISVLIRFTQEFSSHVSSEKLKHLVKTKVDVRCFSLIPTEINIEDIVTGDIIELAAGSIVPTDVRIIECKDLFVGQSMFTGESIPVEKHSDYRLEKDKEEITDISNICLMGSTVISGSALAVAINTGRNNYLGVIASTIKEEKEETNFDKGVRHVSYVLIKYIIIIVLAVFFINGVLKGKWLQALLFSISVAVGLTPGMLPMIVNANLARGASFLARKKTIVKNINAIQNLGAIDVLCTDKTGTLTEDRIVLQKYINVKGKEDLSILKYTYFNSYFGTGVKNLIDKAVLEYGEEHQIDDCAEDYKKIDEIPFDYERRRMSVVVSDKQDNHLLVTKGAPENIFDICAYVLDGENKKAFDSKIKAKITMEMDKFHKQCMHVIAIAIKEEKINIKTFNKKDEKNMTLLGFVAFLDPLKTDAKVALAELESAGINIKILTGDSLEVTRNICEQVDLKILKTIEGAEIDTLNDIELRGIVEETNIFARLSPLQKNRVIGALIANGHVVGYMGDGVNDAPSLRSADVGISVDTATEIARESSDIILLEKDLKVLKNGVIEGRKIFGNIIKYMKMTLSSNFGNMFSVLVGSIFLPFLPMIPIQILIQNMLYDISQTSIPWDNVDEEFLLRPKKWDIRDLERYMKSIGIVSSFYDILTYLVLWFILSYNTVNMQAQFQTGWFLEGLISQTLIVHFIRTAKVPFFESKPNRLLVITTVFAVITAIIIPLLPFTGSLGFIKLDIKYYLILPLILIGYFISVQIVKKWYIKKYNTWL